MFEHDKALDVARSIATRGYFPNEPLLAIKEEGQFVVVEGNRRLAALKALREPGLLEGNLGRQVERLSRQIEDPDEISSVPVTVAPTRRATDKLLAGRHIGTPVMAWRAENRASFILDKLEEGYDNDQLRDQLGFSLADIQSARQTRAISEMARSLNLSDEVKAKLESPRASVISTLERVFDSTAGRKYLMVEPDPDHGLKGKTTKAEFLRGFTKLVTDVALNRQSSRSLNKASDIENYFKSWDAAEKPKKKRGMFVPDDLMVGRTAESTKRPEPKQKKKVRTEHTTIIPKDLKVRYGNDRLVDIRRELTKLKREEFPNAGAVLLRVFLELSMLEYLQRTGDLQSLIAQLEKKNKLPPGGPRMNQLVPVITKLAKEKLSQQDALKVEKAIKYDPAAPFTISELHSFVHQDDLPSSRDIYQFWTRTEPLFRMMLEQDVEAGSA